MGRKTPSSGNNPVSGGNSLLPPLNPLTSGKSGQNSTSSNQRLGPASNINNLKEQKVESGTKVTVFFDKMSEICNADRRNRRWWQSIFIQRRKKCKSGHV